MPHKDVPYPFDGMNEEDYFCEFRELSNTIADFERTDNGDHNNKNNAGNRADEKSVDFFSKTPIFPID